MLTHKFLGLVVIALTTHAFGAPARLKDIARIRGIRSNFLNGLGLVVGLKGTGDSQKSLVTSQAMANVFRRMGMQVNPENVVAGNMAVVMVSAELPPFARNGDILDAKISAVGDAQSLAGGTLVVSPLQAGNGQIYAVAQGSVVVGQASGAGPQVLTVARVPQGVTVEREFLPNFASDGVITFSLNRPDFTTAIRVADGINTKLRGFYAKAQDISSVRVDVPDAFKAKVTEMISLLEDVKIQSDQKAAVVLNERTGTVVMGQGVVISPVAISHGDLSIKIGDKKNDGGQNVVPIGGSSVGELMETLNALGVKPHDLVGILQSLHASGALQAELRFL